MFMIQVEINWSERRKERQKEVNDTSHYGAP